MCVTERLTNEEIIAWAQGNDMAESLRDLPAEEEASALAAVQRERIEFIRNALWSQLSAKKSSLHTEIAERQGAVARIERMQGILNTILPPTHTLRESPLLSGLFEQLTPLRYSWQEVSANVLATEPGAVFEGFTNEGELHQFCLLTADKMAEFARYPFTHQTDPGLYFGVGYTFVTVPEKINMKWGRKHKDSKYESMITEAKVLLTDSLAADLTHGRTWAEAGFVAIVRVDIPNSDVQFRSLRFRIKVSHHGVTLQKAQNVSDHYSDREIYRFLEREYKKIDKDWSR